MAHIVKSGSGAFVHGEQEFPLKAGDLLLAKPDVYYSIRARKRQDLELLFLRFYVTRHFGERQATRQAALNQNELNRFLVHSQSHLSGQHHLISLFEHAKALFKQKPDFPNNAYYHDASLLLLNQVFSGLNGQAEISEAQYGDLLLRSRVIECVEQHLHQPLKVFDIAQACGMSERNLRRKWKGWSARTLVQEIGYRRIERASQLLLLPDFTISRIAEQVGIADTAQFSRLFKRIKSISPAAFRRHHLQHIPDSASDPVPFLSEQ